MIAILLSIVLLGFTFGQLGRIPVGSYETSTYFYEPFLVLGLIALIATYRLKPLREMAKRIPAMCLFVIYLVGGFLFTMTRYGSYDNLVAFAYLARLLVYFISFPYITYHFEHHTGDRSILHRVYTVMYLVILTTAAIQYVLYPDLRNLLYAGWDPHFYRAFGTFLEPVVLGAVLVLTMLFLHVGDRQVPVSVKAALLSLGMVLVALTFARSVYVGVLAIVILYAVKTRMVLPLLTIVMFLAIVLVAPKPSGEGVNLLRTTSIASRARDYQQALEVWKKNPVLGIGFNHIRSVKEIEGYTNIVNHAASSYHSSFMTILVTGGVIGLGLFLVGLWQLARLSPFMYYGVAFLSVVSLFDNVLLHPFVLLTLVVGGSLAVVTHPSRG
jgi:hypothetical protein